ncbi:microfibrillar-associated protein 1 [Anthonomus grandis grandis]|uniref:microfibrillar-associated protein 1 n=1 Tax=Anthonomus grandis grandis TaxID=2921223 RepID=UPI00216607F9|nr:microfibrillar-associated protein 1 [Anthonomus grandis grandis]
MALNPPLFFGIQSTAGAVPVRNEKGELSMQKVKVRRYVSGKRPDYAQDLRSDSESDEDDFLERRHIPREPSPERPVDSDEEELNDPRLKRLKNVEIDTEVRPERRRHVFEAEVLESSEDEDGEDENVTLTEQKHTLEAGPDDEASEEELSDGEIERRREQLKNKIAKTRIEDEDLKQEEDSSSEEEESEEYTDSEEETGPRLKPVFVRKKDRITIIEKEKEAARQRRIEEDETRKAEDRRRQTLKIVEDLIRNKKDNKEKDTNEPNLNDVCTDDENDEVEYEAWKLRELKRIKRDREEREAIEKEKLEIEKLRNMTEEERRLALRLNPKQVTNKAAKGKYKFLQKYYHRGAFYLDKEEEIFKRDFAQATLEDHFDKTILPKVMQVKNFGRSGRTKYTHLVDQDTTHFDSPWSLENQQNTKFYSSQAGGVKQIFEKPSLKKKKA